MTPKIAFIGTGGTISSLGAGPLDLIDYTATGNRLDATGIVAAVPELVQVAEVIPVDFLAIRSPDIAFPQWRGLAELCDGLHDDIEGLDGIVIGHGTATMEETAYFLSLTLKTSLPVVLTGSQRPMSALSTDARMNLLNAVRTASSSAARGRGVMLVMNDEIHAARDVTKTATFRLQTFRSRDFGMLGQVDGPKVLFHRTALRRTAPDTEFDLSGLEALPRVDIAYSYAGAPGTEIDAFVAAGAKGLVMAAFAPGMMPEGQIDALTRAHAAGVVSILATRAGSGMVHSSTIAKRIGIIPGDNLLPQKARILLSLALTVTDDPEEIARIFATY